MCGLCLKWNEEEEELRFYIIYNPLITSADLLETFRHIAVNDPMTLYIMRFTLFAGTHASIIEKRLKLTNPTTTSNNNKIEM